MIDKIRKVLEDYSHYTMSGVTERERTVVRHLGWCLEQLGQCCGKCAFWDTDVSGRGRRVCEADGPSWISPVEPGEPVETASDGGIGCDHYKPRESKS